MNKRAGGADILQENGETKILSQSSFSLLSFQSLENLVEIEATPPAPNRFKDGYIFRLLLLGGGADWNEGCVVSYAA